jgi:teichuronic acid biosynthesis glycosyltransferase TuaC
MRVTMRLLFIANDFPNPSDLTRAVFNLNFARGLAVEHEVKVIAPVPWSDSWIIRRQAHGSFGSNDHRVIDGIHVFHPTYYFIPKLWRQHYGWFFWQSIRGTVRRVLESYTPDAVIGYWIHPDGEAAVRAGEIAGVPAVVMVGGSDLLILSKQASRRECMRRVLRAADAVITVGEDLKAKAIELGTEPGRVHVCPRGVDVTRFFPGDQQLARRNVGVALDVPMLLWVGRMVPVKAVEVLIDACKELRARGVRFQLCLVGDGPLRGALEARVATAGLRSCVTITGSQPQERLPDWYRAADLMVLPSWSEGLPNVLREAGACGTPFVASNVGGIPELADPQSDLLVPVGDVAALAGALATGLTRNKPELRAAKSKSWAESAEGVVDVIRPLVATSQNADHPWWISKSRTNAPSSQSSGGKGWRQMVRRAMAVAVPPRWFVVSGPSSSGGIALTFDDGPHPVNTPRLLDVLRENRAVATFFVVGRMAEKYPEIVRRIIEEGHQVANHTFYHEPTDLLSGSELLASIRRCQSVLDAIAEIPRRWCRPPRGKVSAWKLCKLWREGYTVTLWSVDPRDYACTSADELAARLRAEDLCGGDIVLLHDRLPFAAEVLPKLIAEVRARDLDFCRLDAWLARRRKSITSTASKKTDVDP